MPNEDVQLRTDVEVLKQNFNNVSGLFDRLDTTIEKLTDVSNSINRMLAVHENRLDQHEKEGEKLHYEIERLKDELTQEVEEQYTQIMQELLCIKNSQNTRDEKVVKRIEALENWRWYVMGAAATVGFLLARLPMVHSFLGN